MSFFFNDMFPGGMSDGGFHGHGGGGNDTFVDMALELHADADFTLSNTQTKELLTSSGISRKIEKNYPKLNQLIKYNAVGAVKLLVASGAVFGGYHPYQKSEFMIDRTVHSNSGMAAWKEYKGHVLAWLKEHVNDSADLQPAREFILREICDYYLEKAPRWPSVGEYSDTFTKSLDYEGEIDNNNWIYLWSMLGVIRMQDYREAEYKFKASIWADPKVTMKCVKLDKYELNKWNQQCIAGFDNVKKKADEVVNKSVQDIAAKLKSIKW